MGNTCFLNAVLQCFTHNPLLVNYLRNTLHANPCVNEGFCAFCALRGHVNIALSSSGGVIEPSELVDNLFNLSTLASFQKYQQEDAHEYMHFLLEALHKSLLPPKASQSCLLLEEESFVKNLFGGRLRSQIRCVNCSHCSDTFEPLIDLSLEIENSNSLIEALESFTRAETLECDAKYKCEKCKHDSSFSKNLVIDRAPEVLSIQLKRFINTGIIISPIFQIYEHAMIDTSTAISGHEQHFSSFNMHTGWALPFSNAKFILNRFEDIIVGRNTRSFGSMKNTL